MVTKKQEELLLRIRPSRMEADDAVNVVLFLETEEMQDEMLRYLKTHPKATPEEILEKLRLILIS